MSKYLPLSLGLLIILCFGFAGWMIWSYQSHIVVLDLTKSIDLQLYNKIKKAQKLGNVSSVSVTRTPYVTGENYVYLLEFKDRHQFGQPNVCYGPIPELSPGDEKQSE